MNEAGAASTDALAAALRRMGLAGPEERPRFHSLEGGVSSDIYRVETAAGPVCVKRALARLKVEADWRAPVERNGSEAGWLAAVNALLPDAAPRLLGQDSEAGALAMTWLEPKTHPVWKAELAAGRADPAFAREVGRRLAVIHRAHAGDEATAAAFATDAIFHAIRLEPYLLATAKRHPDLAPQLTGACRGDGRDARDAGAWRCQPEEHSRRAKGSGLPRRRMRLVRGPRLRHRLLPEPHAAEERLEAAARSRPASPASRALVEGYGPDPALDGRAARLLPGLLLARIDGKSPVEYLTRESEKARPRVFARRLLQHPPASLGEIAAAWAVETAV